jgi:nicotinate-nucleotide pyrophosphorylase (carboxylating)
MNPALRGHASESDRHPCIPAIRGKAEPPIFSFIRSKSSPILPPMELTAEEIDRAVRAGLEEDIGPGDVTTLSTVPETGRSEAVMVAREPLVVCGLHFAEAAFRALSGDCRVQRTFEEGTLASPGDQLLRVKGPTRSLLSAERVALNFAQRLSGVATLTGAFVRAVAGTGAQILDTRKTTPGWRRFEKYAVACGGGRNHRLGLHDMILIKDNHLAALRAATPNPIAAAVRASRERFPELQVEVEADTLAQVEQALEAGADIILLDNMTLEQLRGAVRLVGGKAKTEASGGVRLDTVRAISETGVDFISVGALTHSARAMDIALDFVDEH